MFVLFNGVASALVALVTILVSNVDNGDVPVPVLLLNLLVFLPAIAVAVRRMHDTGHRGWWLLVPFVNIVFAVTEGERRENRYGPNPWGFIDGGPF